MIYGLYGFEWNFFGLNIEHETMSMKVGQSTTSQLYHLGIAYKKDVSPGKGVQWLGNGRRKLKMPRNPEKDLQRRKNDCTAPNWHFLEQHLAMV